MSSVFKEECDELWGSSRGAVKCNARCPTCCLLLKPSWPAAASPLLLLCFLFSMENKNSDSFWSLSVFYFWYTCCCRTYSKARLSHATCISYVLRLNSRLSDIFLHICSRLDPKQTPDNSKKKQNKNITYSLIVTLRLYIQVLGLWGNVYATHRYENMSLEFSYVQKRHSSHSYLCFYWLLWMCFLVTKQHEEDTGNKSCDCWYVLWASSYDGEPFFFFFFFSVCVCALPAVLRRTTSWYDYKISNKYQQKSLLLHMVAYKSNIDIYI